MNTRCQSKNPATCRYHNPNAVAQAQQAIHQAQTAYNNATTMEAKEQAATNLKNAEAVYDATDEGYQKLRIEARETRGIDPIKTQLLTYRILKAKLTRATDTPTQAQVLTTQDMETRTKYIENIISTGGSDRFYDVLDKYENNLKNAKYNNNPQEYVKTVNNLCDDLIATSREQQWVDRNNQTRFEKQIRSLKYTGEFLGVNPTLENPNPKMTFQA